MWKILIVDDSLADLELMREMLKGVAQTYLAVNGREAVQGYLFALQQNKPFDLMLLDMVMPEMDGCEVLARLREMEKKAGLPFGQNLPVIMVSAHEKPFMKEFNRTCDDYELKPVDPVRLLEKIELKLKRRS
jgi:two-component system chemotaxis response regulator CheY